MKEQEQTMKEQKQTINKLQFFTKIQQFLNEGEFRSLLETEFHECGISLNLQSLEILEKFKSEYFQTHTGKPLNTQDHVNKSEKASSTGTDSNVIQVSSFSRGLLWKTSNDINYRSITLPQEEKLIMFLHHRVSMPLEQLIDFLGEEEAFLKLFRIGIIEISAMKHTEFLNEVGEFQPLFLISLQSVLAKLCALESKKNIVVRAVNNIKMVKRIEIRRKMKTEGRGNKEKENIDDTNSKYGGDDSKSDEIGHELKTVELRGFTDLAVFPLKSTPIRLAESIFHIELKSPTKLQTAANAEKGQLLAEAILVGDLKNTVISLLTDGFSLYYLLKFENVYYISHRQVDERVFVLLICVASIGLVSAEDIKDFFRFCSIEEDLEVVEEIFEAETPEDNEIAKNLEQDFDQLSFIDKDDETDEDDFVSGGPNAGVSTILIANSRSNNNSKKNHNKKPSGNNSNEGSDAGKKCNKQDKEKENNTNSCPEIEILDFHEMYEEKPKLKTTLTATNLFFHQLSNKCW